MTFGTPGALSLTGSGRDVVTGAAGEAVVVDEASSTADVELFTRMVQSVSASAGGRSVDLESLKGIPAGGSFRKALAATAGPFVVPLSVVGQLLDDVPVTALIGMSALYRSGTPFPTDRTGPGENICSGWRAGGLMITASDRGRPPYMGEGPYAPSLQSDDDPMAWHAMSELAAGSMRRRRRIDVWPDVGGFVIEALFRDVYVEPDGCESVVHEYGLRASLGPDGSTFTAAAADAHVLPSSECPGALASVGRIVDMRVDEIRRRISAEFTGISTCTHLNDMLRSLSGVELGVRALGERTTA